MVKDLLYECPIAVDLTSAEQLELIRTKADFLLASGISSDDLIKLEKQLIHEMEDVSPIALIAVKLARSKQFVDSIDKPLSVSVVFAAYKETTRIRTKKEHPHGEDFLNQKIAQLNWLFDKTNVEWKLILVDDGCPDGTGNIAKEIIDTKNLEDKTEVLFLQDAIDKKLEVSKALSSTNDSRKGGSICYGMWHASRQDSSKNHIIAYTDADLSTHLGQLGLMLHPIVDLNKTVATGSRREKDSVVMKSPSRNNRGKLFIYLWKQLIHELDYIVDTQCGFKAFRADAVSEIIDNLIEHKFAFDIELLLKAEQRRKNTIAKVGIAWIDSEEASTTTDLQPYHSMLQSIAKMYRKYIPPTENADTFASFIEELTEDQFHDLLNEIPDEITSRRPLEFATFDGVSVRQLKRAIGLQ